MLPDSVGALVEVPHTHVRLVLAHPSSFGFTDTELHRLYGQYREPVGFEGHAREAILADAMRRGWIRVRYHARRFAVRPFDGRASELLGLNCEGSSRQESIRAPTSEN
jgi:hypothetical protein